MVLIQDERHGQLEVTEHVKMLFDRDRANYVAQRTEEWHARRRGKITASMVASVCGGNPYESRRDALKKKLGLAPPFKGNVYTEHGNKYEMEAIEKYKARTGEKTIEFGLLDSLRKGEEFVGGSPDGITASGRLIEVKCPYRRKPNGVVPGHYMYQIQTLMHILEIPICDFIEYVPGTMWTEEVLQIIATPRDPLFWLRNFPLVETFWGEVLEKRASGNKMEDKPLVVLDLNCTTRRKRPLIDVCLVVPEPKRSAFEGFKFLERVEEEWQTGNCLIKLT